ncbi:MAG: NUDIX hydrolase [Rubrobacteraceae bacterium]
MDPIWLRWVKRLQSIAQDGLTYTRDGYDVERYGQLQEVAAEILSAHTTGDLEEVRELLELETGPATPKVDVRAAVFREDQLLLVRETEDGLWSLPGGWADVGETAAEATVRETYEESGYRVRAVKLISAYDRDRHGHPPIPYYVYKLNFLCEIQEEVSATELDSAGAAFFREEEIPALSLTRVTPAQVSRFFEHYRQPGLPTDFD